MPWGSTCSTASPQPTVAQSPKTPHALAHSPIPINSQPCEPDELKRHGFSLTKARTIVETARAIVTGNLDVESLEQLDDQAAIERLTRLRGIGRWTAEYVLLRGLGRLQIFPGDDVGAHNKLRRFFDIDTKLDHANVQRLVARWQPYAGMVYFHLLLESLSETGLVNATSPDRS